MSSDFQDIEMTVLINALEEDDVFRAEAKSEKICHEYAFDKV